MQMRQGLLMPARQIQQVRVWGNGKRQALQAEVLEVHGEVSCSKRADDTGFQRARPLPRIPQRQLQLQMPGVLPVSLIGE